MLRSFAGRSVIERFKTLLVVVSVALAALSMWQVSNEHTVAAATERTRVLVVELAARFVEALVTYDYAHPAVQVSALVGIASDAVSHRVALAAADIAAAKATSLADSTRPAVIDLGDSRADVIVTTIQVTTNKYQLGVSRLHGLVEVIESRSQGKWLVSDFHWLVQPAETS